MHVLACKVDEGVVIGDRHEVTVLEIGSDYVRVGIHSPDEDPPYREQTLHFQPPKPDIPDAIKQRFQYA